MPELAIETKGLTKKFDGEPAVDGLDLAIPEGSVFGLVGPNGAGKTTLIRMLMGIITPTSGTAAVLGSDITTPSGELRRHIGYIADVQHMYPFFKVEEILGFCTRVYPTWDANRCKTLLHTFELPEHKQVRALSKGIKTQLALIIALSVRPRLLILDEPTSGLDPVMKHHFMQLIMQEAASGSTTIFFSTHNLNDVERLPDQVAAVMRGKLLFHRSMDELKAGTRERSRQSFPMAFPKKSAEFPKSSRWNPRGRYSPSSWVTALPKPLNGSMPSTRLM